MPRQELKRRVSLVLGASLLCLALSMHKTASAQHKADAKSQFIPHKSLAQTPPDVYRLAAGDILGVYVEGFVGETNGKVMVRQQTDDLNGPRPPVIGAPAPVADNGKITLAKVEPVTVAGMTLAEAQRAIQRAYEGVQPKDRNRILITLMAPRQFQVQVIRQENPGGDRGTDNESRKGTASYIDLPAYQNDVYHALMRTGGVPDFERFSIHVYRKARDGESVRMTTIPTKMQGERLPFQTSDVILQSGDIVFIEDARPTK